MLPSDPQLSFLPSSLVLTRNLSHLSGIFRIPSIPSSELPLSCLNTQGSHLFLGSILREGIFFKGGFHYNLAFTETITLPCFMSSFSSVPGAIHGWRVWPPLINFTFGKENAFEKFHQINLHLSVQCLHHLLLPRNGSLVSQCITRAYLKSLFNSVLSFSFSLDEQFFSLARKKITVTVSLTFYSHFHYSARLTCSGP